MVFRGDMVLMNENRTEKLLNMTLTLACCIILSSFSHCCLGVCKMDAPFCTSCLRVASVFLLLEKNYEKTQLTSVLQCIVCVFPNTKVTSSSFEICENGLNKCA